MDRWAIRRHTRRGAARRRTPAPRPRTAGIGLSLGPRCSAREVDDHRAARNDSVAIEDDEDRVAGLHGRAPVDATVADHRAHRRARDRAEKRAAFAAGRASDSGAYAGAEEHVPHAVVVAARVLDDGANFSAGPRLDRDHAAVRGLDPVVDDFYRGAA